MQGPVTVRPVASFAEYRAAMRTWRLAWRAAFDHVLPAESLPAAEVPADRLDELEVAYEDARENDGVFVAVEGAERERRTDGAAKADAEAETRTDDENGDAESEAERAVVGFAHAVWDDARTESFVPEGDAELKALYVRPERWGEGAGSALLSHVESVAPAGERLVLQTFAANEDGRAFYRARGFEVVGEEEYEVDGASYPTVVFAKPLSGGAVG